MVAFYSLVIVFRPQVYLPALDLEACIWTALIIFIREADNISSYSNLSIITVDRRIQKIFVQNNESSL